MTNHLQDEYYENHPYGVLPVTPPDVFFPIHAVFATSITIFQVSNRMKPRIQRAHVIKNNFLVLHLRERQPECVEGLPCNSRRHRGFHRCDFRLGDRQRHQLARHALLLLLRQARHHNHQVSRQQIIGIIFFSCIREAFTNYLADFVR